MAEPVPAPPLQILWTLHADDQRPALYVNYRPIYADPVVTEFASQHRLPTEVPVDELPEDVQRAAAVLWAEMQTHTPPATGLATEAGMVHVPTTHHLTHYLTPNWNSAVSHEVIQLTREVPQAPSLSGHVDVPVAHLSASGQAAVSTIDGTAIEIAYRQHLEALKSFATGPFPAAPPPQKYRVFVAYRKPNLALARSAHKAFAEYGNHAHFDPYLDEHQLLLGDWSKQLLSRIERSELFVPLVTPDYAPDGSFGRIELDLAQKLHADGQLEIAPIVLGTPRPPAWDGLTSLHAFIARSPSQLVSADNEFANYIRICLATLAKLKAACVAPSCSTTMTRTAPSN